MQKISMWAVLLFFVCLIISAFASPKGNGVMTGDMLSVTEPIKKINVSGVSATLMLTAEKSDTIDYTIDENLKDLMFINLTDGVLNISSVRRNHTLQSEQEIVFRIGTAALEEINLNGAVVIHSEGVFSTDTFTLNVEGGSSVDLALDTRDTILHVVGAAGVSLSGETNTLQISGQGTAGINTKELVAQDVSIEYDGICSAQIHAEKTLHMSGNIVGSVMYWGDATVTGSEKGLQAVIKGD